MNACNVLSITRDQEAGIIAIQKYFLLLLEEEAQIPPG
jgi:hypothetical protein